MFGVRVLSRRMGYRVERTQEIYAVGSTLLLSGFFPVYAANNSLGASNLLQESGATTQVFRDKFYLYLKNYVIFRLLQFFLALSY
jgi:MFS superfamily sulfate permease-like transporter